MLRMEIALFLVLGFVAYSYFAAEKKFTQLHHTFSMLLVVVLCHLVFDGITVYTVNHLETVPLFLNNMFHRLFIGTMILIFFLLGLLAFPHKLPQIIVPSLLIALFLTFVARPVAVFGLLLPFRCSIRQCLLVSWAGLRGAASIVFAIMAVMAVDTQYDIFHIVFFIVLFSLRLKNYNLARSLPCKIISCTRFRISCRFQTKVLPYTNQIHTRYIVLMRVA